MGESGTCILYMCMIAMHILLQYHKYMYIYTCTYTYSTYIPTHNVHTVYHNLPAGPKPITRSRQPAPAQSHAQAHAKKPASSHPHHASYSAQIAPPRQPPSPPPTVQPYEMVGKSFECSCRKCSLESSPKTGGRSTFLPNLPSSPNRSGTDRQQRESKLKQESDAMIFRFGGFVSRILRSFKSQSIAVPALIECISNFGAFQPNREQSPLLLHRMEQLKVAGSIDEIFLLVSDYVSYFNHALMVHMVGNEAQESR